LLKSTDEMKGDARLTPMAFRPANQLPDVLPEGAHRVITEMTSAKMRMMMQGTVIEGTGRMAALNGYSAGGKTGTAQKVDPVTHTYSHTKLVASFAGFAPVSNPAISIAVVIDTPTVGTRYGAETSAPVFAEVAQQVLEYLGVPHDQPLKTKKQLTQQQIAAQKDSLADGPSESGEDINALFAEINNLPADDPLRASAAVNTPATPALVAVTRVPDKGSTPAVMSLLPAKVAAAFRAASADEPVETAAVVTPKIAPKVLGSGAVTVGSGEKVAVPEFGGEALRSVVERAEAVGLRVQLVGSGLAREQVPMAGTMVPTGTEVVVRFAR
jgi:cell division protein FtsI (penicillin-binding protein 3)